MRRKRPEIGPVDKRPAGVTDDLSASINYGEVSHMITDFTRKHTFKLLRSSLLITGSVDFPKQRDASPKKAVKKAPA